MIHQIMSRLILTNQKIKACIAKKLLLGNYKKFVKNPFDEKQKIVQEIDRLNARLSVATI
ncbi:MAG: hypothetical protein BGO09_04570 [Bacteroidetes bacterium 47-18]|nr:MAG: hypothetical protein BGO09_04570 [Bacteroidetes bacterium 47-18]